MSDDATPPTRRPSRRCSRSPTSRPTSRPTAASCAPSTASRSRSSAGKTLGIVGESGSGKTVLSRSIMGLLPKRGVVREGSVRFEGVEIVDALAEGDARVLGRADGDDLPGPDDVAEPGHEDRQADHRVDPPAPRRQPSDFADDLAENLLASVRIPEPRAAAQGVPAPALGRHAPARVHRGRAGVRTEAAVRRRADHRARRDRAGAGPRPHAASSRTSASWRWCSSPTTSASSPAGPTRSP